MAWRVGVDVGGTFTDLAAVDDASGAVRLEKVPTTPADQSIGVAVGLTALLARHGVPPAAVTYLGHGTTVCINAVLERKGARTGLVTTQGMRDLLELRRQIRDDLYDLQADKPEPLVPRDLRREVPERTFADGHIGTPLDLGVVRAAIGALVAEGVEALAVCFLHSYVNPSHERAVAELVRREFPDLYPSISSDVLPEFREFERLSTTVMNAYVGPVMTRYLGRFEERVAALGLGARPLILQSNGGVATVSQVRERPVYTMASGPTAGVTGAAYLAARAGHPRIITFDMGGTSTDIALVQKGEPQLTGERRVDIAKVALPSLDIHTLGAGGGSIARVAGTILHVGPGSAGADPGPACYGKGGTGATVTDANLVLGYLDPANFLGGRIRLDVAAARAAVARIARPLGTSPVAAALGIAKVVNTNMAEGIKIVSVRRGVDPRKFTLVSFGGAAGLHITEVARLLEIRRVVVPNVAAVFSAWGMLATDLRHELVRSHLSDVARMTPAALRRILATMEDEGRARLAGFPGAIRVHRSLDMRYGEQIFEIQVPIDGVDLQARDAIEQVVERFHQRHEELYAYHAAGQEVVIVNARVAVVGALPELRASVSAGERGDAVAPGRRRVYLGDWVEVPVHRMEGRLPGYQTKGPAIFESDTTTVLIRERERVTVTPHGWLDIELG